MPPSRSICAMVHAIRSSLVSETGERQVRQRNLKVRENRILNFLYNLTGHHFSVSPTRIAARKRPSGFNASLHCSQKVTMQVNDS